MEKKFDNEKILESVKLMLEGLGLDLNDPNLVETPDRIMRSYYEIFEGLHSKNKISQILSKSFPTKYSGMVLEGPIDCYSMCPHHFLPITYKVYVGYIPRTGGLGLSKIPRLVELLAKAPKLQEDFTDEIVYILQETINPLGVMCFVKGEHLCMQMRGTKKSNCSTITSSVSGVFKVDSSTKQEFMSWVNKNE